MKRLIVGLLLCGAFGVSVFGNDASKGLEANKNSFFIGGIFALKNNNYEKALEFFKAASDEGIAEANYYLSNLYKEDWAKKDIKQAFYYAKKGAELGDENCIDSMGSYYLEGKGGEKDYKKAVDWYSKAKKDPNCLMSLGLIYYEGGHGIKQDKFKTYKYFRECATTSREDEMNQELKSRCQGNLDILCKESPWACK